MNCAFCDEPIDYKKTVYEENEKFYCSGYCVRMVQEDD